MKKNICFVVLIILSLSLTGCPPRTCSTSSSDETGAQCNVSGEPIVNSGKSLPSEMELGNYGGAYGGVTEDVSFESIDSINSINVVELPQFEAPQFEAPQLEAPQISSPIESNAVELDVIESDAVTDTSSESVPAAESQTDNQASDQAPVKEITKDIFGTMPSGENVYVYTLTNANGVSMKVLNLGGIIFELNVPDKMGKMGNISANLETVDQYLSDSPNFGTLVGRYGNRIAKAKFTIDDEEHQLVPNDGENLLHGGNNGFHKKLWGVEEWKGDDFVGLKLSLTSDEKDQGFPGTVQCLVTYKLNDKNELEINYEATTDKATPINLTQHTYFNMSAFTTPNILDDVMMINADHYIAVDSALIPTGEIASVEGTPMDFRKPTPIGERIDQVGDQPKGYDHCYVLNKTNPDELTLCARVYDPTTGRAMEVWTTEPGVQFYTGNFLDGKLHAFDHVYEKNAAFCLETQHFPDSPNHADFPNTILHPGETYKTTTVFKFDTAK